MSLGRLRRNTPTNGVSELLTKPFTIMIVYEDMSFATMTAASLNNEIDSLYRAKAIWLLELIRCGNNVKASKNHMERDFWQGRQRNANEHVEYFKKALAYLTNIKANHYD